jgi:hypothetical protein
MSTIKTSVRQPLKYRLYAWAGRRVYALREKLSNLNNWLDRKAGQHWIEDY